MKINSIKIFLLLPIFFTAPNFASADPSISSAPATISDGQSVTIEGSGFGAKSTAPPIYFATFDSDTAGQMPPLWAAASNDPMTVNTSASHSGTKAFGHTYTGISNDYFPRIFFDLGNTIPLGGTLYLSTWLLLDTTGTTASGFNWKGPLITSNTTTESGAPMYWENGGTTTNHTAFGFAGFYAIDGRYYSGGATNRWFNTAATIQNSTNGMAAGNYCTSGNGWAADAFVLGNWQRVEYIFKMSSTAGGIDGSVIVNRIGKSIPALAATGCNPVGNTGNLWRYVAMPQGITNIYDGTLTLNQQFDDVYIDSTTARVELCDSATWSARTHCEIQKPTAWSDTSAAINLNQGTFSNGSNAYFYVVDENGSVNSDGYSVTLTAQSDTTAPSAPSGLSVL